jgi:hypothetical protein
VPMVSEVSAPIASVTTGASPSAGPGWPDPRSEM